MYEVSFATHFLTENLLNIKSMLFANKQLITY